MVWILFVLLACAAIAAGLLKSKAATRCLIGALLGSLAGYLLAPLLGTLVGLVPSVMIEPQYFTRPFCGCIATWPLFLACMTAVSGVLLGLVAGAYIGFRRRGHA